MPPLKIYVAGAASAAPMIKSSIIERLKTIGHHITFDWTEHVQYTAAPDLEYMQRCAAHDTEGACTADLLLIYMDTPRSYAYRGSFTELGMGLALGKKIIIVRDAAPQDEHITIGTNPERVVFYHHPSIEHVATLDEAFTLIERHALSSQPRMNIVE